MTDVEFRTCRGCGARFERTPWALDRDLRASPECWRAYGELAGLVVDGPGELGGTLQLAVDAYGAQHGGEPTPAITVVSGLAGLHLALECGADGDAVRDVHTRMGRLQPDWPVLEAAPGPSGTTVLDVLAAVRAAGSPQVQADAVRGWARAVWDSWTPRHAEVAALVERLSPESSAEEPTRQR